MSRRLRVQGDRTMKLIWRVSEKPTGRYRAFQHRAWPCAYFDAAQDKLAAQLICEDDYRPAAAASGQHAELKVLVNNHNDPKAPKSWKVYTLKQRAKTLQEAKDLVQRFFEANPSWTPKA